MGAWIEMNPSRGPKSLKKSHPTWVRGLKFHTVLIDIDFHLVAPHVGAWIEIDFRYFSHDFKNVAPHVGAWIEIRRKRRMNESLLVAPHVGAWIEIAVPSPQAEALWSHPTWVRGLK